MNGALASFAYAPARPDATEVLASDMERLANQLSELRGAVQDALDAETLDRTRELLRRALQ